mmetsp:Transcript_61729/g.111054  ORF Transcript_61729/g.111054 Transcript_61729/m.111054 type:complete len:92 (+) Transcript_61729:613-888(+)
MHILGEAESEWLRRAWSQYAVLSQFVFRVVRFDAGALLLAFPSVKNWKAATADAIHANGANCAKDAPKPAAPALPASTGRMRAAPTVPSDP